MVPRFSTLSFLSDFGLVDEFVGVVHSVIASIAAEVTVIDITHGIKRHDVRAGGLALARSASYLCPGVVVAVVDPGVGSTRRPIVVEVGDGESFLVGPDNGLLAPAVALVGGATRAVELTNRAFHLEGSGGTFDGRDVFGPVGAHLCNGVALEDLGELIEVATLMPGTVPVPEIGPDQTIASVLWIDTFGNVQLNLGPDDLSGAGPWNLLVGERQWTLALATSFDAVPSGQLGFIVDSQGLVAVSAARADASAELEVHEGSEVSLCIAEKSTPVQVGLADPKVRTQEGMSS
jgi:S-adenosylmethionine hydrolase